MGGGGATMTVGAGSMLNRLKMLHVLPGAMGITRRITTTDQSAYRQRGASQRPKIDWEAKTMTANNDAWQEAVKTI
tara:strand:+ start:1014 stop:1241 length:228 start_codon:yes stop_codon:yes gene_type:complete